MDETGADYTEWSKPDRKTPIQYTNTYIWNLERWQWWPCMQDSKRDTVCITDFWTQRERERVGWFGRMALKHAYYQVRNESPVYVRYSIQDACSWCTGMIQRDDMGWEVGRGGFRIGNSCTSPKHPVSCIEHRLAICFLPDSIHVSMPFSQIIPPSPSPTESKSPFYTSVSLLLSCIEGYHYHLSKFHIYVLVYCIGTFESVLMRWMKLEPIIQTEVSQKEKHQYSILTHIYGI